MKKYYLTWILLFPLLFFVNHSISQCIPGDAESCPDPEGNGEICPDTLAPVIISLPYHQEITMLPPSEIDTLNITAELYHITLVSIEGLPEGIVWETNSEGNIFEAGKYYCILFSGTSDAEEGVYPIKVVVDLYIKFFNDTLVSPGIVDSTSLSILVMKDASNIGEVNTKSFVSNIWPNPFRNEFDIKLTNTPTEPIELKIYNLLGQVVYKQDYQPGVLSDALKVEATYLPDGMYFVSLESKNKRFTQLISKSQ